MPRVSIALGVALLLIGVTAVSVAAAQGGGGGKDPLKLFEPMYPVFSDDRCANCHGGVNVVTGEDHPGGPVKVQLDKDGDMCCDNTVGIVCATCHDEGSEKDANTGQVTRTPWKLAPQRMSFAGKDLKAMCIQVRDKNGLNTGDKPAWNAFYSHLEGDELVGFAFEGKRGITAESPEGPVAAELPPVSRDEFLQMADKWLREGDARCGPWTGAISETTTRNRVSGTLEDVLDVQIDVKVEDGDAKAHITLNGHTYSKGQACAWRRDTYKVEGDTTVDLNILINKDLLVPLNLPGGLSIPNVPNIPGVAPGGLPNVPVPDFGDTGYTLMVTAGNVKGTDQWEESRAVGSNPPRCSMLSGTNDWPFQPTFGVYMKTLDPNDPDHLKDSDSSARGADEVRVAWDLTR